MDPRSSSTPPPAPSRSRPTTFRRIAPGGDPLAEWPARRERAAIPGQRRDPCRRLVGPRKRPDPRGHGDLARPPSLRPKARADRDPRSRARRHHSPPARPGPLVAHLSPFRNVSHRIEPPLPPAPPGQRRRRRRPSRRPRARLHELLPDLRRPGRPALARPGEKLVAAVFAKQSDYLAILQRKAPAPSPRRRATTTHAPGRRLLRPSRPARAPPTRRIDPPRPRRRSDSPCLLDLDYAAPSTSAWLPTRATHQLIAATRLAPRHDAFPTWLHEGLAAQFETIRGGRWAGIGRRQRPAPSRLAFAPSDPSPGPSGPRRRLRPRLPPRPLRRGVVSASISCASPTPPSSPATSTSSAPPPTDDAVDTRILGPAPNLLRPPICQDPGGRMAPLHCGRSRPHWSPSPMPRESQVAPRD